MHQRNPSTRTALALAAGLLAADTAQAAFAPYTDYDAYLTAIAGLGTQTVEGFDAASTPVDIASGTGYGDLAFHGYNLDGQVPRIVAAPGATSSSANALETDGGSFFGGDGFSLTLAAPMRAFGLFVISGDSLTDGDLSLDFGGGSVSLDDDHVIAGLRLWTDFQFVSGTNANLYFLGGIADVDFTGVTLSSADAAFNFALDDLRYSAAPTADAPVPPTALLLLGGLALVRRRRAR